MRQVAGDDREHGPEHERRVCRTPEDRNARHEAIDQLEDGRERAERVEQHHQRGDGEEAHLPGPEQAAGQADGHDKKRRQRAEIELAHVLRESELARVPARAVRAPVIDLGVECAEQVADNGRQQGSGMQRAPRGFLERDLRSIGGEQKENSEQQRQPRHGKRRHSGHGQRRQRPANSVTRRHCTDPMGNNQARQYIGAE